MSGFYMAELNSLSFVKSLANLTLMYNLNININLFIRLITMLSLFINHINDKCPQSVHSLFACYSLLE